MNTPRRYPRTLQEAFGPYTSTRIEESSHAPLTLRCAVAILLGVALAGYGLAVLFG